MARCYPSVGSSREGCLIALSLPSFYMPKMEPPLPPHRVLQLEQTRPIHRLG